MKMSVSEFAKALGVEAQTIRDYENGKSILGGDKVAKMIQLGVDSNWLLAGPGYDSIPFNEYLTVAKKYQSIARLDKSASEDSNPDLVNIPCLNVKASAGYGNHVYEERVVGHFQVSRAWVRNVLNCDPGKVHIIFVDGPSMEPTLEDGELVLIDRRCEKFDNDAVYAIQFNGQLRIKRVQLRWDGTVVIKSDNPKFEPDILTQEQADQLHVIGKVLPWKFGKYRL